MSKIQNLLLYFRKTLKTFYRTSCYDFLLYLVKYDGVMSQNTVGIISYKTYYYNILTVPFIFSQNAQNSRPSTCCRNSKIKVPRMHLLKAYFLRLCLVNFSPVQWKKRHHQGRKTRVSFYTTTFHNINYKAV